MDNKIDEIFSNKLGSFSKEPSTKVWNKLKSELDKKEEKKAVWWYYVAASLILFVIGYISFPYLINIDADKVAVERTKNLEKLTPRPLQKITSPDSVNQHVAIAPSKDVQKLQSYGTITRKKSDKYELVKNPKRDNEPNPIQKNNEDKVKQVEMLASNNPTDNNALPGEDISHKTTDSPVLEPVTVVIKRSNVSLAQQVDTTEKASFRNRLGKVYTQVMNLKNGEKVELEELGIKSNLLAFNKREKQTQDK